MEQLTAECLLHWSQEVDMDRKSIPWLVCLITAQTVASDDVTCKSAQTVSFICVREPGIKGNWGLELSFFSMCCKYKAKVASQLNNG